MYIPCYSWSFLYRKLWFNRTSCLRFILVVGIADVIPLEGLVNYKRRVGMVMNSSPIREALNKNRGP